MTEDGKTVATNRRARFEYHLEDTYEAGLVFTGTEGKSLRAGRASMGDAVARVENGEVWVALLQTHGVSPRASAVVADALVLADMRGVASHGIMRLPIYLERLRRGAVAPDSTLTVLREMPAMAVVDAGNGLGIPAAAEAMRRAMAKAQEVGAAWVAVRNSNHFGMAAYFALMATHEGMIGLAMTNSVAAMAPFGAVERYTGTNPIAVAVPAGREPPLVMDMARMAAAWGRIALAAKRGTPIPEGWAMDDWGRPVTEAVVAQRAIMLPFGGPKGSALALLIQPLART